MSAAPDTAYLFNVVWTGGVFEHLRPFVCSLLDHSAARFRFVTNACTPEAVAALEAFAAQRPDRVVEVLDVTQPGTMVAHGVALDSVYRLRDDGDHFCFVDADIRAVGPWIPAFSQRLADHDAVTSGREVWNDDNVVPEGHPGVGGRHFYDRHGFVFGSPHFAMYRRAALDDTFDRWGVSFGSAGPDIPEKAKAQLLANGHDYLVYDTGKVTNILLQHDGHRLCHWEHPDLMHIGGMSHFLSPPKWVVHDGEEEPDWVRFPGMESRVETARYTADVLRELNAGRPAPALPEGLDPAMGPRLAMVRQEMIDLVAAHRAC